MGLLSRLNEFECVVQGDCSQAPDSVLRVVEHRKSVAVTVPGTKMGVASVTGVAYMTYSQRKDLLHLWDTEGDT